MKTIPKEEIYKHGNFIVSKYDFRIPSGERSWTVLQLIELKTIKKRWSDETSSYYKQSQYITISQDQLAHLIDRANIN